MVRHQVTLAAMKTVTAMATATGPDANHAHAANLPLLAPLGVSLPHQNRNLTVRIGVRLSRSLSPPHSRSELS